MRLEVMDDDGAVPRSVHTAKWRLRLAHRVEGDDQVPDRAVDDVVQAVAEAKAEAQRWCSQELFGVATAVVRHAPNRQHILERVHRETRVPLVVLSGREEAARTYLAARRWMGWRAGPMALLDIGGGSLEVAFGHTETPDFADSAPLGAGLVTRKWLAEQDPPAPEAVESVRREVRHQLREVAARVRREDPATTVVTSRTLQQLARLCGAAPEAKGPFVARTLTRKDLRAAAQKLVDLPAARRAELPGITRTRAPQSAAGAVVAHTAMKAMGIRKATVCPWALREGALLHRRETGDTTGWISLTE